MFKTAVLLHIFAQTNYNFFSGDSSKEQDLFRTEIFCNIINTEFWHPIGLTQSGLMTSLSHGTADWFSPVLVANELAAQYSNIWLVLAVAVCSMLQKPSTFPSSTCIDLLPGDSCMLHGGYFMYVIFAAAVFLTCSQQHVVDVLQYTGASQ